METTATIEWSFECPHCGRSCLSRFYGESIKGWEIYCSDCFKRYQVEPGPEAVAALLRVCHAARGK